MQVRDTLASPATITVDTTDNSALPSCGATCNSATAFVNADPLVQPAPGHRVEISAGESIVDRCLNGTVQFRFWIDGDGDLAGGGVLDTLARDWTDNAFFVVAPNESTDYVVDVRCSEDHACADSAVWNVGGPGAAGGDVPLGSLLVDRLPGGNVSLSWSASCSGGDVDYAVYEGSLGSFASHLPAACSTGNMTTLTVAPAAGDRYFLIVPLSADREGGYGNVSDGAPRPPSAAACLGQLTGACD